MPLRFALLACNRPQSAEQLTSAVTRLNEQDKPPDTAVPSAVGFETKGVVQYQPDPVLAERISGASELAGYIKKLQSICGAHFRDAHAPETLDVVVALKP